MKGEKMDFDVRDVLHPLKQIDVKKLEDIFREAIERHLNDGTRLKCNIKSIEYGNQTQISLAIYKDLSNNI